MFMHLSSPRFEKPTALNVDPYNIYSFIVDMNIVWNDR